MAMKRVIVAGHLCVDITPAIPDNGPDGVQKVFSPGRLTRVGPANTHIGGTVANTGLAMKMLGVPVSLMGKTGADDLGRIVRNALEQHGAAEGLIVSPKVDTSYTIALAVPGADRIFLHHPGANDHFTGEDIPEDALRGAALFHFGYPPLMRAMYINRGEALHALLQKARKAGCAVSLDMAAVDERSEAGQADWPAVLRGALPLTDFFLPSAEELLFMLDREKWRALSRKNAGRDLAETLNPERDLRPLADTCLRLGARAVLIKCGAAGLYLKTAEAERLREIPAALELNTEAWGGLELFERAYRPEKTLSSTGAGDTAIAAFLTAVLSGCSPEEAIRLSAAEGACCLTAYDALSGLLPLDRLREKIAAGWEKTEPVA